jgi:BirA family transcriptional regulator, biotin operon repressor / biotin---[acetyl-CoA-carboxylase] ligase
LYKIQPNSLIVGKNLVYLPTCHSTNDVARDLIHLSPPPDGTVVISGAQTAGKGLRGNSWHVEPHMNLTFSVILFPVWLTPPRIFDLTLAMSLGVLKALHALGFPQTLIKWPNDIYSPAGKIGGMLVEPSWSGTTCSSCIVGIGLNVNQTTWNLPRVSSLALETGNTWELSHVLNQVLESLDVQYQKLANPSFRDTALPLYYTNLLGYQKLRRYRANNQEFYASILSIDAWGHLEMVGRHQERYSFDLKEVEFCWD